MSRIPLPIILRRLEERVVNAGGEVLAEPCRADELTELAATGQPEAYSTGCGGESRLAIPYDGDQGDGSIATVCAVDDMAYLFPRFL